MDRNSIWVKHPGTGREIDVAPLLRILDDLDRPESETFRSGGLRAIQQTIRVLNHTVHDPQINSPITIANIYRDLHLLGDAFASLVEREPRQEAA